MKKRFVSFSFIFLLASFLSPQPAFAHAFGKLYNLPVPFWMYLYGGAAAIIVSFLIIGYFTNKAGTGLTYPTKALSNLNFLIKKPAINVLKGISVFLFLFTILTGLIGEDSPYSNFNMTFFWIIFVLGFSYLTAFIGNIYTFINPFKVLVEYFEQITGEKIKGAFKYPENLGYYPALFFYFLFIWIELFSQTFPRQLSLILIQYTIINVVAVMLVGKDAWFKYGEFF